MKIEEMVEGEIYFHKSGSYNYLFRYQKTRNKTVGYKNYLDLIDRRLHLNQSKETNNGSNFQDVRASTSLEKRWFIACEKAGKCIDCPKELDLQEIEIY